MSKLFFDGRIEKRENHGQHGFSTKRMSKPGTADNPLSIDVRNDQRKAEIEAILQEHALFATINIDPDAEENTLQLDTVLKKPQTVILDNKPSRNDPCSCGSGKKFKKCCG